MAITILVRNPESSHDGCRILYHDIGDYLKREEKLSVLREAKSIAGISNWQTITPDRHNDWIGQRSEAFQECYPVGSKGVKAGKAGEAIFKLYSSNGLARPVAMPTFTISLARPAPPTPVLWWETILEPCANMKKIPH